jgi:hypothetical protein
MVIPLQDKLDRPRTEIADAIEENNCLIGTHAACPLSILLSRSPDIPHVRATMDHFSMA